MKKLVLVFLFALAIAECLAQSPHLTTFILVRHAEKGDDGTKDPDLKLEGTVRAERLAAMMKEIPITAIYSTAFKRTRNTVQPLAASKGLEVLTYEPMKAEEIEKMLSKHKGGTIVIVGHSNTIPWTANLLTGTDSVKDFADADYSNFLVVTLTEKGNGKLTWLKY